MPSRWNNRDCFNFAYGMVYSMMMSMFMLLLTTHDTILFSHSLVGQLQLLWAKRHVRKTSLVRCYLINNWIRGTCMQLMPMHAMSYLHVHDVHTQLAKAHPKMSYILLVIWITCYCLFAHQVSPHCQMHNMWPNFGKPGLSCKLLLRVIRRFRLVTVILSILSFVDNHEEQSLSFHLVHIWSLYELYFQSYK